MDVLDDTGGEVPLLGLDEEDDTFVPVLSFETNYNAVLDPGSRIAGSQRVPFSKIARRNSLVTQGLKHGIHLCTSESDSLRVEDTVTSSLHDDALGGRIDLDCRRISVKS